METGRVFVSAVVAWEISAKVRSGKWPAAKVLADRFFDVVRHDGFTALPVTLEHAHLAGRSTGRIAIRSTACSRPRRRSRTCRW